MYLSSRAKGLCQCFFAITFSLNWLRQATGATPAQIQTAIDRGKAYLYATEKNGNWEVVPAPLITDKAPWSEKNLQYGGMTAVATFALLATGEDPQKPQIKSAIDFLKKLETRGTYSLGLRAQIWNMIPIDDSVKIAIRRDRDALLAGMLTQGAAKGFYGYGGREPKTDFDHSASQFAVLGMWALSQAGAEVPSNYWRLVENSWKSQQFADGSWAYFAGITPNDPRSASITPQMVAAGVATLAITQEFTNATPRCGGNVTDPAIEKGMQWLGDHLVMPDDRKYYALFGISRVGLATGYKYIGSTDWFEWGADQIVESQSPEGFWAAPRENFDNVPATAFSLLFLSRGRAPIMMNKLNYDVVSGSDKSTPGTWNQRPRDVANLTRRIGKQIESELNWQIVTLRQKAEDLHEAPILYISGGAAPKLNAADQAKLKEFIEDGGLVFGHADCSAAGFSDGFRKLGEAMFPGRTFVPLPADHPIYVAENFPRANWKIQPALEGLSNGDRELMLLLPTGDPGKTWQTQSFPSIRNDIFGQMMIDILLYATDQQGLRYRDETYLLKPDIAVKADKKLKVARLKYTGNWDPEPGGWRRLAIAMHNDRRIDLDVHTIALADGGLTQDDQAADLVLNGPISLSETECKTIRDYVNGGGTLLVDIAGGSGVDRSAAEAQLVKIFPDTKDLPQLPVNSPVYSAGGLIKEVTYRRFARPIVGNTHMPRLRGFSINGRIAVILSAEDISAGLVGQSIGGIVGYSPESAVRLMENMLTYAGKH